MAHHSVRFSLAAAAAALALAACGGGGGDGGEPQGGGQGQAPTVTVAEPLVQRVADWDSFTGRFESPDHVDVRARVSGYIEEVHFEDGAQVEAGDRLFTLDKRPYEAALAAAEGAIAEARAQVSQAETDANRAEGLRASDAISEEELEQSRTALATAQAALAAAEAQAQTARLDLEFAEVTAPVTGRASSRRVDPGNLVSGGTSQGDILTTIVSADPMHFAFEASEAVLLRYQRAEGAGQGAPAEVRLQDEGEFTRSGEIVFADNQIQPGSGTIAMKAEVSNTDGFLRPGMLGEVRVRGSSPYDAMLIPRTAVVSDGARRLVYVVNDENEVQARPVELGPVSDNLQIVKSGIERGDRVVIEGGQAVQPGAQVQTETGEIERDPAQGSSVRIQPQPASSARPVE